MPIYEYECSECQRKTERLRRMSEADDSIVCEHCGHFEIFIEIEVERPTSYDFSGKWRHQCSRCNELTEWQPTDLIRKH